jgi:uncharacterized protein YecT (DUF1311 family)
MSWIEEHTMVAQGQSRAPRSGKGRAAWLTLSLLAGSSAIGAPALGEPVFAADATEACVIEAHAISPGLCDHAVLDCAGRAAAACMMTPGGDTTIGMIECLGGELSYWNERLTAAYAERTAIAAQLDADLRELGSTAARMEESLQAMQAAWASFRDTSCLYEQAQWMGGTGAGPATMACHMKATAQQALKLEGWWGQ